MSRLDSRWWTIGGLLWGAWWIGCSGAGPATVDSQPTPLELQAEILEAFAEPRTIERMEKLASAMKHLNSENVEAVRLIYEEYIEGLRHLEMQPFFDAWTRFDGVSALEYAESIPFTHQADIATDAAISTWAVNDLVAARVAAQQAIQSRPNKADAIHHALVRGWASAGHSGLDDHILGAANAGPAVVAALPAVYQRAGSDGLMEWSNGIINEAEEHKTKMKTYRMTVRAVAFRNPRSAIPFVLEHYGTGEDYAKEGPRVLTEHWMRTDPGEGLKWLKTQAPEEVRAEALGLAFGTWLNINRAEARQWLDALPPGDPYYQPAYNTMARRMAKRSPRDAIEWCGRGGIGGELNRDCLRFVATEWYKRDPVAAGRWLEEESGLPIEDLQKIRQLGAQRRR